MTFNCILKEQIAGVKILACGKPSLILERYGMFFNFFAAAAAAAVK